jgi:ribonuclease E
VISVEMTEEEQDVYSFMGISPLILSNEPVKDPKSTIVAVALPGQSTRMPNGISLPSPVQGNGVDQSDEVDEGDDRDEVSAPEPQEAPVLYLAPETTPSSYAPPVLVKSVAPVPAPEEAEDNSAAEDGVDNTRRRRRRRSTAN